MTSDCNTEDLRLAEFHAIIEPIDFSRGYFGRSEETTLNIRNEGGYCEKAIQFYRNKRLLEGNILSFPVRKIESTRRGVLVRELRIYPLVSYITQGPEIATVELSDFPRSAFYEARDALELDVLPYLSTETVRWNSISIKNGIVFAYISPPFHSMRNLIAPFIGLSYIDQWLITLLGLIITAIIVPIFKPLLFELAKGRIRSLFKRENPEEVTLIVSSTGAVKTIEVKKKPPDKKSR